ncbi:uncharacterized protein B0I36DRAFT_33627 [Microdochium trichocladiopsis]|uniref:Uncharacterized protein n=1 Tax=Microdochium trichocladiopsis TaxID=1682393 RepID=A0A9P8XX84_9PEZI|nr:uncharacterized protein B0I36DRAFT_33627 [Microdochium trichocladiopsis]KAH7021607.1 hypothetical protein B0I36DRAFT_33627 [Microdochium trichocladiopsis]
MPLPDAEPIPHIPVFRDGICCLLCSDDRERYVCRGRTALMTHLKTAHGYTRGRSAGRICGGAPGGVEGLALDGIVRFPMICQAVFHKTTHYQAGDQLNPIHR